MTAALNQEVASPGDALIAKIIWVHDRIRHDLAVVQQLSASVLAGASPEEIDAEIGQLQTNSPLWKLRVNCLYYCRFAHSHHMVEDVALFPELRRTNPAVVPVVDKLESDHRIVSDILDAIEAAVRRMGRNDTLDERQRLVDGLDDLHETLLEHLAFEEVQISPALLEWPTWPQH